MLLLKFSIGRLYLLSLLPLIPLNLVVRYVFVFDFQLLFLSFEVLVPAALKNSNPILVVFPDPLYLCQVLIVCLPILLHELLLLVLPLVFQLLNICFVSLPHLLSIVSKLDLHLIVLLLELV